MATQADFQKTSQGVYRSRRFLSYIDSPVAQ